MQEDNASHKSNCPFLTPKMREREAVFSLPAYCRLPNGRVRVPTHEQLVFLCTAGQHHDCPGYRRWKPSRYLRTARAG